MNNRTDRILEILSKEGKTEVQELADRLKVSTVTMRKDLDLLESQGIIARERGYASICAADDIAGRIAFHYPQKQQIAKKAASMVRDGESLMIENGSCCALLADRLASEKKDLTIITNSAFIADYIRKKTNFQIILLGGIYQHDSQVNVGPLVRENASHFLVDRFFIGVDGYDERCGFTNKDTLRAQAVADMAEQANEIIVLTESDKFNQRGTVPLRLQNRKTTVITDSGICEADLARLKEDQIHVILSEPESAGKKR